VEPLTSSQYDIGRTDKNVRMQGMNLILAPSSRQHANLEGGGTEHDHVLPKDRFWRSQRVDLRASDSDTQLLAVTGWLQSHRLTIEQVDAKRFSVNFSGSVAQVEEAFRVEIHDYLVDGKTYRANANHPSIPVALSRFVSGVSLADFSMAPGSGSTETILYTFTGSLNTPELGGIMDTAGTFYGTTSGGGTAGLGSVFKVDSTGHETVLYSFKGYPSGDGANPNSGLVMDVAGNLYGTTRAGGNTSCTYAPSGCGIVFKLDPAGQETVLHSFTGYTNGDGENPNGDLIMDGVGNLYGTTSLGGASSSTVYFALGTVYKVDNNGQYTILYSFCSGTSNCPDGAHPNGGLVLDTKGNLYGTTNVGGANGGCALGTCGTVFALDPAGHETVLYSFTGANGDGANPEAGLILDSAGNLFGTTVSGGNTAGDCASNGCGTVFKLNPAGQETLLYTFTGVSGDGAFPNTRLIMDNAGNLYGTTPWALYGLGNNAALGTLFKLDPTGHETVLLTFTGGGEFPNSSLIMDIAGSLYGSTSLGGSGGVGTLFKLDSTGHETVIYNFPTTNGDGAGPTSGLIRDSAGNFYGTTAVGGTQVGACSSTVEGGFRGCGTVFKLDSMGNETVLHTFTGGDGANPQGSLVIDSTGNLYGTTLGGGLQDSWGTVFKLDEAGNLTLLHEFFSTSAPDGFNPAAGLITDSAGNLYGTTLYGGATYPGAGTVFKLDTAGHETMLYSFTGVNGDGAYPYAGLVMDHAGNLYGTTLSGGTNPCPVEPWLPGVSYSSVFAGCGTVFKVDPNGHETVLYRFTGANGDGAYPAASLNLDTAGNLYGTTFEGGASGGCPRGGCGTAFKLDPTGKETVLYSFTGTNGDLNPVAPLIFDSAGNLYGTTSADYGGSGGNIFLLNQVGLETVLYTCRNGCANSQAPLIMDSGGNLYGTGLSCGLVGVGCVFELAALPIVSLSTTAQTFGDQLTGTASSQQTVTLANTGSTRL
jgi:uncharacterized repeat protein (TIGR03803 family)